MLTLGNSISKQGNMMVIHVFHEGQALGTMYVKPENVYCNSNGEAASFDSFNQAMSWMELKANP